MHTGTREIKISKVIRTKSKATEWLSECKCSRNIGGTSEGKESCMPLPSGSHLPPCKSSKTQEDRWCVHEFKPQTDFLQPPCVENGKCSSQNLVLKAQCPASSRCCTQGT